MKNRIALLVASVFFLVLLLIVSNDVSIVSGNPGEFAEELQIRLKQLGVPINQVQVLKEDPVHIEVILNAPNGEIEFDAQWARLLTQYETEVSLGEWLIASNRDDSKTEILAVYEIVFVDSNGVEIDRATQFVYSESVATALESIELTKMREPDEVQRILQDTFSLQEMGISSTIATSSIVVESNANLSGNPRFVNMEWLATKETDLLDVFRHFGGVFSNKYADLEIDFVRVHVIDNQGEWLADYGGNFNLGSYTFRLSDELSNLSTPSMPPEN